MSVLSLILCGVTGYAGGTLIVFASVCKNGYLKWYFAAIGVILLATLIIADVLGVFA
jgi:hypothetical protein